MNAWSLQGDRAGVTKLIRQRLNFVDEIQWKRFSARRLELIDRLELSSKKASEQDAEISGCALQLLREFEYPVDRLPEFDRLVRCAVQSARRNRKRSKKARTDRFVHLETPEVTASSAETTADSGTDTRVPSPAKTTAPTAEPDEFVDFGTEDTRADITETASRLAISSLITPVLSMVRTNSDHFLSNITSPSNTSTRETKALAKLQSCFKRSKTCFQLTTTSDEATRGDVLENLGNSAIASSVILTIEQHFDNVSPSSASYIRLKLSSDSMLAQILKSLGDGSFEVTQLNDYLAAELFKKLIGGCIKDFGYDYVLTPLGEIFRCTIIRDYPLAIRPNAPSVSDEKENATDATDAVAANQTSQPTSKTVELRFANKTLQFSYLAKSNSPPTLLELLENARSLFSIVSPKYLRLRNKRSGKFIDTDFEVERLFADEGAVEIEIFQF
ncbi:unnamed protein product [Kuraishia capsulata CBS 1993]|uniref:Uncharacterized protein n=1 Tax=Kuraishia capsulata CBS 1993 TaxID=1382522 RepID=W6MIZ6_9ASCO|nr:uncharacterized protein KUCA_T00000333001 [Kuraishia capsulata CBS 1993]CDK24372.1 unnamed protein product [Kuraishia capsulata CBS 1993]